MHIYMNTTQQSKNITHLYNKMDEYWKYKAKQKGPDTI